ncbi:MAG: hypothetical protein ACRBBP_00925 [Bdellovibrionales bacterium]
MKNKVNYKKEIVISLAALCAVSFILMNLKSPKPKSDLQEEVTKIEKPEVRTPASSKKIEKLKKASKKKPFEEKIQYTFNKVKGIELCLEVECDYPDNDPREYSLSVYKDLSVRVSKYSAFWVNSWSKMTSKDHKFIIGLLNHDDGFVKKEVLAVLNSIPNEEASKYLDVVLNEVIDYHDSELIPEAMAFLEKTQSSESELLVAQKLSTALRVGGPHVSQEISKGIHKFITPNTAFIYEETLPSLPEEAPETTYLMSALTEYEMQQSGG